MTGRGRIRFALAGTLVVLGAVTCTDGGLTGPRGSRGVLTRLGFAPMFSKAAAEIFQNLEAFGYAVDNVHVRLQHANGTTAKDTIVVIGPTQDSVVIQLGVNLDGLQETLTADIELRDDNVVLFSGSQSVTASVGGPPAAPPPIPVNYTGPGAGATTLALAPRDTAMVAGDSLVLKPTAKDASGQTIANAAVAWSVKDATRGIVNAIGVFKATTGVGRGETYVVGRLLTGPRDSTHIVISLPATKITLITGGGQTAVVGQQLSQPIVVETQAADNLAVPYVPLSFQMAVGGGSVSTATAVSDINGRATVNVTLGTTAGTNGLQVTGTGLAPLQVTATGTPDKAAKLSVSQQPSSIAASGSTLAQQPAAQLKDTYGNAVSAANVTVTASLTVPVEGRSLSGTLSATTNASGAAQFTDLKISGPPGTASLTFSQDTLASAVSGNINVTIGPPATLALDGPSSFTAVAGALMTNGPAIVVTDAGGNGVPGVGVLIAVSNAQGPVGQGTFTTDANGRILFSTLPAKPEAGAYTFTVSSGTLVGSPVTITSTVTNAEANKLRYVQQPPASVAAATTMPIVVELLDQFNNRVTTGAGATANVTLGLGGGATGAVLGPDAAARTQAATAGVATFTVSVNLVGTGYVLSATAPDLALPALPSSSFAVTGGAAALVAPVAGDGVGLLKGDETVLKARVTDVAGNDLSGVPVTFTVTSGGGTLSSGTVPITTNTGTDGTAVVDFRPGTAGAQTVQATSGSATPATFTVFIAETLFVLQEPPANPASGVPLATQPKVQLRDLAGNVVKKAGVPILAEYLRDPALQDLQTALYGTVVATTDVDGVATFTDLALAGQTSPTAPQTVRLFFSEGVQIKTVQATQSLLMTLGVGPAVGIVALDPELSFRTAAGDIDLTFKASDGFNGIADTPMLFGLYGGGDCQIVTPDSVNTDASGLGTVRLRATAGVTSCGVAAILPNPVPPACTNCTPPPPFLIDRVFIAPAGTYVWVGDPLASTNFNDGANWYESGVRTNAPPTPATPILVAGLGLTSPVVNGAFEVAALYGDYLSSMTLEAGNALSVHGDVNFRGSIVGTGGLLWADPRADVRAGQMQVLSFDGSLRIGPTDTPCAVSTPYAYTMVGPVAAGDVDLRCQLEVADQAMIVKNDLNVLGLGLLSMTNPGGAVIVQGNGTFNGSAVLNEGTLEVDKDFSHTGNGDNLTFVAQPNHITVLGGDATTAHKLTWNSDRLSRFGYLEFVATGAGGVNVSTTLPSAAFQTFHVLVGNDARAGIAANVGLTFDVLPGAGISIGSTGVLNLQNAAANILSSLLCTPALKDGDNAGPLSCSVPQ